MIPSIPTGGLGAAGGGGFSGSSSATSGAETGDIGVNFGGLTVNRVADPVNTPGGLLNQALTPNGLILAAAGAAALYWFNNRKGRR